MTDNLVLLRWRRGGPGYRRLSASPEPLANLPPSCCVLKTCERNDLIAGAHDPHSLNATLADLALEAPQTHVGDAAVRELFRVAAGLDSRLVGETHILGQVRAALEAARDANRLTPTLGRLLERAIRVGRRVRADTALGRLADDYAEAAARRIAHDLSSDPGAPVAVIGSGALARDVARALRDAGLTRLAVCARHPARARHTADLVDAAARTLDQLPGLLADSAAAVSATSSPTRLVTPAAIPTRDRSLLLVDLGEPPNIDPACDDLPAVRRVDLDDLAAEGRSPRLEVVARAESIVAHAAADWIAREDRRAQARQTAAARPTPTA